MSKEVKNIDIETEEEYIKQMNTFAEGFITNIFSQGIISEVDANTLKRYFSNPDCFQEEIEKLAHYYYITTGEVHQLFEMVESLPSLNYKVESENKSKSNERHISTINKAMRKLKHKRLSRDLLKQTASSGTLVGIWLGDKTSPYPYIFDQVKYVEPKFRRQGNWVCTLDLEWISQLNETDRQIHFNNLSPYVTEKIFNTYKSDITKRFIELPQERTFVLQTGTLKRNQNMGTSWVTPGLYDVLHKKKLKDVERSIANKIINAVAVLTIGSDKLNGKLTNSELSKPVKQKIHSGVKTALEANNKNGVTVISIPDYASIDFPDVKTEGLDGKKFEHINNDIEKGYGLSSSLLNGDGGNYSSAKINLDGLYKRLEVLLEDIEQEVYQKLINLILPSTQTDNFYIVYEKEIPLTLKEKIDVLTKLNDKGWATKYVVDSIKGVNWEEYLEQTLYETEILKLQEKIKPYQSTYTMNGDGVGQSAIDNPDNENTIKSKTSDGNNTPE